MNMFAGFVNFFYNAVDLGNSRAHLKRRTPFQGTRNRLNVQSAFSNLIGEAQEHRRMPYDEAECEEGVPATPSVMELDLLDKKIRRLVTKLKRYNIDLEVFSHKDVEYGKLFGKGGEGMVRQCTIVYNGVKVEAAAKTVCDNSEDAVSMTLDEIELLCLAKDQIISTTQTVYGVVAQPCEKNPEYGRLVILTEAGIMNALQLYQEEPVPLHVTLELWSRLAAALHTMHSKKIIHQDLKPENILITSVNRNKFGQVCKIDFKVIDLGMAKRVYTEKIVTDDILGTNGYHPPEVLFEESYDFRADIFMLGITFCVLLHSPEFLKSKELQKLLKGLHTAKKKNMAGEKLFEAVVKPSLGGYVEIPETIQDMLYTMLETQERRDITLLDIANLCRETGQELRDNESELEPPGPIGTFSNEALVAARRSSHGVRVVSGSADSGFSAGGDTAGGAGHLSAEMGAKRTRRARRRDQGAVGDYRNGSGVREQEEEEEEGEEQTSVQRRRVRGTRRAGSRSSGSPHSGRSEASVFSIQSDLNGLAPAQTRRATRSQSFTSVRSDVTVTSDISDVRKTRTRTRRSNPSRAAVSGLKRLRCDSTVAIAEDDDEANDEFPPPAQQRRRTTRVNYTVFYTDVTSP